MTDMPNHADLENAGFRLVERIESGGQGTVWLGKNNTGHDVAIKILDNLAEHYRKRFSREVRKQSSLEHPNIVPILYAGLDHEVPFFVMPLAKRSLSARLGAEPLDVEAIMSISHEILDGLECAHNNDLVHRDLKPGNVLEIDNRWMIGDFGLCIDISGASTTMTGAYPLGTPGFMAPEQAANPHEADLRADLYSVGVLLYVASTGQPPTVVRLDLVPSPFRTAVDRCLRPDPEERPQSVSELRSILQPDEGQSLPSGRRVLATSKGQPRIEWATTMESRFESKNNGFVLGDRLFISGSGQTWNMADSKDGLYCINPATGDVVWHAQSRGDANGMALTADSAIVGTDEGDLACFNLRTGKTTWITDLGSAVVSRPKIVSGLYEVERAYVTTSTGNLHAVDTSTGEVLETLETNRLVIGDFATAKVGFTDFLIPCAEGALLKVSERPSVFDEAGEKFHVAGKQLTYPNEYHQGDIASPTLWAPPLVTEDRHAILPFVRETYFPNPPLYALSIDDLSIKWAAECRDGYSYGNIRHRPVAWRDWLLIVCAYDSRMIAVRTDTGVVEWSVALNREMFQQWAEPLLVGDTAYVASEEGLLHKIDLERRVREWSLSVGDESGLLVREGQTFPGDTSAGLWNAPSGSALRTQPVHDRGKLFVPTADGTVVCVALD